jgi:GNAT superfamily N-acetyltransferase
LTALVVREPSRGQGIGHRLVAAAEEIARGRGCRRIEVTSAEHRTDAHDFYRHLGYAETSRRFIKHIPEVGEDVTEGRKLAGRTATS